MSVQSKTSAFPETVQPGIPRLPERAPAGWKRTPLKFDLYEEKRPVSMKDDEEYDLVTVKRGRGGVVRRERKRGADISVKTQFELKTGDFLISKRQIVHGACGLVPEALDGSTVSNEYAVLRSRGNIDLEFMKYLSNSIYFQQTCFHSSIGVHIEKMIFKTEKWLRWNFDIPPLQEQRRIAEILSTWDRAIEATEKLIANSEAQKKALMQKLLTGEKRLPGFKGEWKLTHIKEVGETSSGGTPESENAEYWEGEIAWATPTDITALSSPYINATARYISESGLANSSAKLLPANSLIICTRATVGKSAIATCPITTNQGFKNIIPNSNYDVHFLYYLLNYFQHKMIRAACGSTFLELSKSDFDKLSFKMPSIEEQNQIGSVLSVMDEEIESISETLGYLKSEKSALMQQLLTGKRRVAINKEKAA